MTPGVHTFILKLWVEPNAADEAGGEWRGEIAQVSSNQVLYFRGIERIAPTVQRMLADVLGTRPE
jgi:hypothetical protein